MKENNTYNLKYLTNRLLKRKRKNITNIYSRKYANIELPLIFEKKLEEFEDADLINDDIIPAKLDVLIRRDDSFRHIDKLDQDITDLIKH